MTRPSAFAERVEILWRRCDSRLAPGFSLQVVTEFDNLPAANRPLVVHSPS